MFYIEENGKIVLFNENISVLTNSLLHYPQYKDLEIKETNRPIVDFEFSDTEEYLAKKTQEENNRINRLTMTALDFINILKQAGFTIEDRKAYFAANPEVEEQLTFCQNVYCGVVRQLCPITYNGKSLTEEMVIKAFEDKSKNSNGTIMIQ